MQGGKGEARGRCGQGSEVCVSDMCPGNTGQQGACVAGTWGAQQRSGGRVGCLQMRLGRGTGQVWGRPGIQAKVLNGGVTLANPISQPRKPKLKSQDAGVV